MSNIKAPNSQEGKLNGLAFGILAVLNLDLNLRKNEKNLSSIFLVMWKYLRKRDFRAYFHGLCLVGYKSINRR